MKKTRYTEEQIAFALKQRSAFKELVPMQRTLL